MARLSLIICDLCKSQMEPEESKEEYSLALSSLNDDDINGELCTACYETLRNWMLAPTTAALEKPSKSLSDSLHDMVVMDTPQLYDAPVAQVKAVEPPPSGGDRGKIEPGELNIISSRFDKKRAAKIINDTKGSCAHHFKSYDSGKIICGAAPPGYTGELSSFKGCGKTLIDAEF